MIHVFFVPGMFGSMIEYVLKSHTLELIPIQASIRDDGSMHGYSKNFHPTTLKELQQGLSNDIDITTPIYPCEEMHLEGIIQIFRNSLSGWENHSKFIIHAPDLRWAEINLLFQYYKISLGLKMGMDIFSGNNSENIARWNPDYTHWQQMKPWEYREWFSMFYENWVQEWINIDDDLTDGFMRLTNQEILENTKNVLSDMIKFCNLTPGPNLYSFLESYREKQSYVLDEYAHIEHAVKSILNDTEYKWPKLSIIGESIIQRKLRSAGLEIRCDRLDDFPTHSVKLKELTYRSDMNLHQHQHQSQGNHA
jgi:hypothetical protein